MAQAIDSDTRDYARGLYFQGLPVPTIAGQLGLKPDTVYRWALRYAWKSTRTKAAALISNLNGKSSVRVAAAGAGASARVRALLADEVEAQAQALAAKPPRLSDLPNNPQRQGRAAVAKCIAETAAQVFDWESSRAPGLIIIGEVEAADPGVAGELPGAGTDVIDVPPVLPETAQPDPVPSPVLPLPPGTKYPG